MEQKNDTITIRKDTLWKYSTFILLAVVILGVVFFVLPGKNPTGNVINQQGQQLPSENARIEVDIEGDPIKGDENAEVTFVEFSDFQCPYCQRHFMQSSSAIEALAGVKVVHKDYPLPFHQNAQKAAEAAHCARDQGGDEAFFAMHDILFTKGSGDGTGLDVVSLKQYAKDLGLNTANFNKCLDDGKFADEVATDLAYGSQIGVQGTPAFFIFSKDNKKAGMISGACPSQTFISAINAEKAGKNWAVNNCQFAELA